MSKVTNNDNANMSEAWVSTYALITTQFLLEYYQIKLSSREIVNHLNNNDSVYRQLLQLPASLIKSGIILEQAKAYLSYLLKRMIDYVLSGESIKDDNTSSISSARENLEKERQELTQEKDKFNDQLDRDYRRLIAKIQKMLIHESNELTKLLNTLTQQVKTAPSLLSINLTDSVIKQVLMELANAWQKQRANNQDVNDKVWNEISQITNTIVPDAARQILLQEVATLGQFTMHFKQQITDFSQEVLTIDARSREARRNFHDFILRIDPLIKHLPTYVEDKEQLAKNKENLLFNADLGNESPS